MIRETKGIKIHLKFFLLFIFLHVITAFHASCIKMFPNPIVNGGRLRSHQQNEMVNQSPLETITLQPIGHVSSVYRLCVGTPRQGLLAPNSRGRIDLYPTRISSDSVIDLDKFSHLWIVFIFHLNSNNNAVERSKQKEENGEIVKRQFPSKISPPALGGKRVGIFATRSPHRPNPVGFTLCKIDKIVIPKKKKHQKREEPYHIYISGIDLVDGTPVVDIKPYVPHYDSVGFIVGGAEIPTQGMDSIKVPEWVSDGLGK
jgi:tRNA-Thr(GGU) m(6)t(6)A37 methyltransferase TsaA